MRFVTVTVFVLALVASANPATAHDIKDTAGFSCIYQVSKLRGFDRGFGEFTDLFKDPETMQRCRELDRDARGEDRPAGLPAALAPIISVATRSPTINTFLRSTVNVSSVTSNMYLLGFPIQVALIPAASSSILP